MNIKTLPKEIKSLESIINKAAQNFKRTTLSEDDWLEGQEALKGCQSV